MSQKLYSQTRIFYKPEHNSNTNIPIILDDTTNEFELVLKNLYYLLSANLKYIWRFFQKLEFCLAYHFLLVQ